MSPDELLKFEDAFDAFIDKLKVPYTIKVLEEVRDFLISFEINAKNRNSKRAYLRTRKRIQTMIHNLYHRK